ncbi:MAG: hypothetical protein QM760_13660 [Nibricoccus sp.]
MNDNAELVPWRRSKDVIPKILIDGFHLLDGFRRVPEFKKNLNANGIWQDRFDGEVFVLANGPSLSRVDRKTFVGKPVIVMNSFDRADWKAEVRIVAHCIGEPRTSAAWTDPAATINGTKSESYWLHYTSLTTLPSASPDKRIHYVLPAYGPRLWGQRKIDLSTVTLGYQTTAQLAIMVALYMGFKDIKLLGFDHDWLASPKYSKHFYSSEKDHTDKISEFSYYQLIGLIAHMWEIYYAINRTAKQHGATIKNMTDGSYLDVFPKCAFGNGR